MGAENTAPRSASEILELFPVALAEIEENWRGQFEISGLVREHVETELRYKVYLEKQRREIEQMRREQFSTDIGELRFEDMDSSICKEDVEKLKEHRPQTIHAASRIQGIKPTTLLFLHQLVKRTAQEKIKARAARKPAAKA